MQNGSRGRWALAVIAAPAAVAIWSGWVGLGGMCGFGVVNLLPGIGGGLSVNTAITLPVGVEAYAAFALGAWLAPGTPERARQFARWSVFGALCYGLLGQVAYHLLVSHGYTVAPVPVVVLVSCMPVVVLGFAAALTHLLRPVNVAGERSLQGASAGSPATLPGTVPSDKLAAAKACYAATAAAGNALSQNQLAARFGITRAEARGIAQGTPAVRPSSAAGASGRDAMMAAPPTPSVPAALNGRSHG